MLLILLLFFTGCLTNPFAENLTGNWMITETKDAAVINQYSINIIQIGETIRFLKDQREIGHGTLFNDTITVTAKQGTIWSGKGIFIISITDADNMESDCVPCEEIMSFHRLIK